MRMIHMQFPGGKSHAFTISYDDGVESDFPLADLMRKYGIRGTFNVNTSGFAAEGTVYPEGTVSRRMSKSRFLEFFRQNRDIAEIAAHGATHNYLPNMEGSAALWELLSDRKELEDLLKLPCRGFAAAYGGITDETVDLLEKCGFYYARKTKGPKDFSIPTDPLRWTCTCHHTTAQLMELAQQFLEKKPDTYCQTPYLFSVWGHSYEFDGAQNWNVIEELFSFIGNREEIWYCTNIEFFRYLRAFRNLEFFADQSRVYNPSALPVSLMVYYGKSKPVSRFTVQPGELLSLEPLESV